MSDGLSEGYRWAQERDALQDRIDAFFAMIVELSEGRPVDDGAFKRAFETLDAHRYADSVARGRLEKRRGARWKKFRAMVETAVRERGDRPWSEILALSLRYASSSVTKRLLECSDFDGYRVALYVPEGRGRHPSLHGDHEAVFDAASKGGLMVVIGIDDPERAVVAVELGPKGKEILEPERAKLRFIAVRPPEGA